MYRDNNMYYYNKYCNWMDNSGVYPDYEYYNYPYSYYNRWKGDNAPRTAIAIVKGGPLAPNLRATVWYKDVKGGTEVCVEAKGLPDYKPAHGKNPPVGPHGFHIHENGDCEVGDPKSPFKSAGGHWNPTNQPHGNHAGDFPVIFSNHGYAAMCFFTDKFKVKDIIGKAIIIHESPDDYRSQPAGDAGKRLACGIIKSNIK